MFPTLTSFEKDLTTKPFLNKSISTGAVAVKTSSMAPALITQNSKLIVSNVPLNFDHDAVYKFLRTFGKIRSLELIKDPITGKSSGQCTVEYENEQATSNALHCKFILLIKDVMGVNLKGNILYIKRSTGPMPTYSITNSGLVPSVSINNIHGVTQSSGAYMTADDYTKFKEISASKIICIKNMVTMHELEDDEEYEELYEDVLEECKNYGKVTQVKIPRPEGLGTLVSGLGKVFVEYFTRDGAAFAKEHLNGKNFHNRIVEVVYHPEDMYRKNQLD